MIVNHQIKVHTPARHYFHDVTEAALDFVENSKIKQGVLVVYSQHTSCCVLLQEESEDTTYYDMQFILQDTLNIFEKLVPRANNQGAYLHPGPIHIENAARLRQEHPSWGLNTDGHIISSILGRSELVPIVDGELMLGEFGRLYFGDLDQVRQRERTVWFQINGE